MKLKRQIGPEPRPVVDWLAGQIQDPVAKLRFLRVAAAHARSPAPKRRRIRSYYVLAAALCVTAAVLLAAAGGRVASGPPKIAAAAPAPPRENRPSAAGPVWEVEKTADYEVYSNGLRIETRYEVSTHPRRYMAFPAEPSAAGPGEVRGTPAGIVFHATESRQAPFEERENRVLRRLGESTVDYVRRKRAYNFVIDRFGRVYRVVRETDAANHAGYSLWADQRWVYVNLNESFLGVSFEAGDSAGQEAVLSPAQKRAAAVLIEMLRSLYRISAEDCVTHAQVSVNPANMRVGYHTDWASGFPFESVGLPENYEKPLWAVALFGFDCDRGFLDQSGPLLRTGVQAGEDVLAADAAGRGVSPTAYRLQLHRRYRETLAAARKAASGGLAEAEPASAIQ
jgi:N-acetylmuramoyl-L-alanine amidase